MKITGMLLIALSCSMTGMLMASNLSVRTRRLEGLCAMLDEMLHRLRHLQPTMQGLIYSLSLQERFRELVFLEDCRERMRGGRDFPESWKEAVRAQSWAFGRDEAEIAASLGDVLGRADMESQLGALRLASRLLEERANGARARAGQLSGLYRTMGALCGAALIILFF